MHSDSGPTVLVLLAFKEVETSQCGLVLLCRMWKRKKTAKNKLGSKLFLLVFLHFLSCTLKSFYKIYYKMFF